MSKLTDQLRTRLAWAKANPEKMARLDLNNGLGVTLYVDDAGDAHVLLTRTSKAGPSLQEAATVVAHWPEPVTLATAWRPGTSGPVTYLANILIVTQQLALVPPDQPQKSRPQP